MKKRLVVAITATLVIAGSTVAFGDSPQRRIPVVPTVASSPIQKPLAKMSQRLTQAQSARVRCRSAGCVNRSLTRLAKAVKVLSRDAFKCEKVTNVTQYSGYLYTPDGGATVFSTTGLDYTAEGDTPTDQAVVYVC